MYGPVLRELQAVGSCSDALFNLEGADEPPLELVWSTAHSKIARRQEHQIARSVTSGSMTTIVVFLVLLDCGVEMFLRPFVCSSQALGKPRHSFHRTFISFMN